MTQVEGSIEDVPSVVEGLEVQLVAQGEVGDVLLHGGDLEHG